MGFSWLGLLAGSMGAAGSAAMTLFAIAAFRDHERRAGWTAVGLALLTPLPYLAAAWWACAGRPWVAGVLLAGTGATLLVLLLPTGRLREDEEIPPSRVDERDIPFSRWRLMPGSPQFEEYYARRPDKKQVDDRIRALPGLFRPGSRLYHPLAIPAAEASFAAIQCLQEAVEGPVSDDRRPLAAEEATRFVKGLTAHYGASSVGVTELRAYHVYSHVGRGAGSYGAPIELTHGYAIAFTVEMRHAMIQSAPSAPEAMEVARQYLSAAAIAVELALFIRSLGYPARAHIDGNYQVICPLVARDAGLGEIGRMGLLMTPRHGPRERIGVVTTDLPLLPDRPTRDPVIIDFCRRCQKCAENCPSRSIPREDRQVIDGVWRWQIDGDTCFRYWNAIGTDCGRCIAVCPYAHPDGAAHNLVRWAIRRSSAARWLALRMDDVFYGRRPKPHPSPGWMDEA